MVVDIRLGTIWYTSILLRTAGRSGQVTLFNYGLNLSSIFKAGKSLS